MDQYPSQELPNDTIDEIVDFRTRRVLSRSFNQNSFVEYALFVISTPPSAKECLNYINSNVYRYYFPYWLRYLFGDMNYYENVSNNPDYYENRQLTPAEISEKEIFVRETITLGDESAGIESVFEDKTMTNSRRAGFSFRETLESNLGEIRALLSDNDEAKASLLESYVFEGIPKIYQCDLYVGYIALFDLIRKRNSAQVLIQQNQQFFFRELKKFVIDSVLLDIKSDIQVSIIHFWLIYNCKSLMIDTSKFIGVMKSSKYHNKLTMGHKPNEEMTKRFQEELEIMSNLIVQRLDNILIDLNSAEVFMKQNYTSS